MLELLKDILHEALYDEQRARRWLRALFLWGGGAATSVCAVGWDTARLWTLKEWAGRLAIAAILGLSGLVSVATNGGDK